MDNVFYFKSINKIGGVESHFYYLSRLYKNMTIYYKEADPIQVERLAKNVKIRKYKEPIKCDKFFCNYGLDVEVEANVKKHIIHCDYKEVKFKPIMYPGFDYIAVSKLVGEHFTELTGKPYELIYNPIVIDKPNVKKKEKLTLISATRLTGEKGGWRIDKLSEILDKAGIKYDWYIYTNKKVQFRSPNIHLKEPKLDLTKEIAEATYLVQLSNAEAYCYSVVEALCLGTPVIITPLPVFDELKITDKEAIRVGFDLKNVDIDKIKQKLEVNWKPPKSNWNKYLDNNSDYDPEEKVKVKVLKGKLLDIHEGKKFKRNEEYYTPQWRASYLEAKGYVDICD